MRDQARPRPRHGHESSKHKWRRRSLKNRTLHPRVRKPGYVDRCRVWLAHRPTDHHRLAAPATRSDPSPCRTSLPTHVLEASTERSICVRHNLNHAWRLDVRAGTTWERWKIRGIHWKDAARGEGGRDSEGGGSPMWRGGEGS